MGKRLVSKIIGSVGEPKVKHYRGLPPEVTGLPDRRELMQAAVLLLIEERPDGAFLFRFTDDGRIAGDTWHANVAEAQNQARFEFGEALSEWKPVPREVEDAFSFGFQG